MKGRHFSLKRYIPVIGTLFLWVLTLGFSWAGTCTVDATQTNQYIHCIGASSAWSAIGSMGQALFAEDNVNGHIGISSLRARIDPNNSFSSEVNQLATAHSVNSNVLLWATEWSPPAQYKANNNVDGGSSNDTFLGASSGSPNSADTGLASYQVSFIQYCQSHGAPLYALSIQNEPNFNPTYEACLWTAGQFDVYANAFHSALQSAGLSTKIMLPEPDNTGGMNLASTAMDDSTVAPMIGIIGTHLYGSPDPAPLSSYGFTHVTNQEWWETEMSGNSTDIPGALQEAGWIHNSLVNSNMNAFHYWWLTDLISGSSFTIKAYALGNYSKFIRPGYYRMGATAVPSSGVSVSAFKNTNTSSPQTIVFVAINGNSSSVNQTFSFNGVNVTSVTPWVTDSSNNLVAKSPVAVSGGSFTYSLTSSSITSFVGVVSGGTPVPTATPTFTPTPIVSSTWRVNAGGPAYTGTTGLLWAADENYSGGSTAAEGGAVTGTSDSTLYDTQRYGSNFSYSFNVPAGAYQVTLKFAETYSGDFANGDRVFNVAINGTTVLANLDVYSQVGANTADDKVINNVSPSGGVITIQFTGTSSADTSAMVEAIQVIPQPATPTSTFTPTLTRTGTPTFTATPAVTNTATFTRTNTAIPPTATNTNSPVPPTITNTPAPPTVTNTPAPPTATGTNTPVPPTATSTNSPVPPTITNTPAPPTVTNTPAPPTATSTRTNTPVPPTATPTAVVSGASFEVQLLSSVTSATTNSPHPQIQIVNTGSGPLSLNSVTVRYWFNCDCTTQTIQAWVDWAGLVPSGSTVSSNVKVSSQSTTLGGQTSYILYSFSGNMVLQPGQAIQVQSRFNKSDWSNFTQSEDWSYAANTSYANDSKATGYVNGALVWGQEPSGTAASMSVSNVAVQTPAAGQGLSVKAYPNPSAGNGVNLSVTLPGNGGGVSASVMAKVYTLEGRLVWSTAMPASSSGSSGNRAVYWNEKDLSGNNLANGLYVVAVVVKSQGKTNTATFKLLILK